MLVQKKKIQVKLLNRLQLKQNQTSNINITQALYAFITYIYLIRGYKRPRSQSSGWNIEA